MNTELVSRLREKTAAGMSECIAALKEAGGEDFEKAVDLLKIRGQVLADSKATKVAAEGVVLVNQVSSLAAMVEINAMTDFTSRSPDFIAFAINDGIVGVFSRVGNDGDTLDVNFGAIDVENWHLG